MDSTEHVVEQFETGELVLIAEALGLAPTSRWGPRKLTDVIRARLRKKGIPKGPDELVADFLYVDHWVDEDGKPVNGAAEALPETLEEYLKQLDKEEPDCFGFADSKDPACKKCPIWAYCAEERVQQLPSCFGRLYDDSEVECQACIEAPFCKGVESDE